jgi:cytoskeletal protein RodZ
MLVLRIHTCLIKKGELVMKSQYRMFFAFVVLLLIVSMACNFGASPTQLPSIEEPPAVAPTDQPQEPQQPEAPQQTEEPAPVATEPPAVQSTDAPDYFTEEFDGDISNWTYFTSKNDVKADDSGVEPVAENGFLVLDLPKNLNV